MSVTSIRFREQHLFELLSQYDAYTGPLDFFISTYFRKKKALGSKDRAFISETIYTLIRWKGLIDYFLQGEADWKKRYEFAQTHDLKSYLDDETIPPHIRVSFPDALFHLIGSNAQKICLACNEPAPTTVRVNIQKIRRDVLLEKWKYDGYDVVATDESDMGITFKINFFSLPEFQEGLFEVQDEASQLVAFKVQAQPGDHVLDFCSGSGGKTLAFAHRLEGKGQIFLHDVRKSALLEAKKRLNRAGIQNAQFIHADEKKRLKLLFNRMNWVLVDAPCSGTGTLRRNPDMKWKFSLQMLERLVGEQRTIFEEALQYLHPTGRIVYATCSILEKENQEQVAYFLKKFPLQIEGEVFQSIPKFQGKDGFFAVTFKRHVE
jgi:16S rRNA C967 or C1407 C5-methylase (RsmB/RsmF family)